MTTPENITKNNFFRGEILRNNESSLKINFNGGLIESLVLNGVEVLGSFNDINGKKRATHICCPFFNIEGMEEYGMPRHGVARDLNWYKNGSEVRNDSLRIETIIEPTELYRSRLLVSQIFELKDDKFNHTVVVRNGGKIKVPVNIGIHNYWDTPKGWKKAMINGSDITEGIKENSVDEVMRVGQDNIILISGVNPINWHLDGFSRCVLWTASKENEGKTIYDCQFMCAEPVVDLGGFFGSEKSMLDGGGKLQVNQTISLGKK